MVAHRNSGISNRRPLAVGKVRWVRVIARGRALTPVPVGPHSTGSVLLSRMNDNMDTTLTLCAW